MHVCVGICLSASISLELHVRSLQSFFVLVAYAVAQSSWRLSDTYVSSRTFTCLSVMSFVATVKLLDKFHLRPPVV